MKKHTESYWEGVVKSMGLVFGDIGTSPIYTLTVIFALTKPTEANVFGILSMVVWTLIILVTVEYAWLAMSLGRKGEGGTIVLKEILIRLLKPGRQIAFVGFLSFVGVSLLLGDGVITPAISILSAVEGLVLIPGLESMRLGTLILIAALIAVVLFIFQFKGTDKVAAAFGPLMVLWFGALTVSGLVSIATFPKILGAVSPHYAINFFRDNGISAFFVLSEVILCATGGEALYADMGHLGRRPIIRAWYFVFVALIINYLGQGAFALQHGDAKNFLFNMVQGQSQLLYIPFLILTILATVIASQALISGVFSIVYQGITTRIMPLMKVDYTSSHLKSQIYIGSVNWFLMLLVIFIMLIFQKSENLAAAYGLAVTGTMTITGIMMTIIFAHTTKKWKVPVAVAVTIVDVVFLISNLNKLPHGGYWSIILASVPFATILIWTKGQQALYRALKPLDMETFLLSYEQIYAKGKNITGTGLFFTREWNVIPPYVVHCIIRSNIIYERNIFISIVRTDEPFGLKSELKTGFGPGLDAFEIKAGYMEVIDIEKLLKKHDIQEKVIFYGIEDIATMNPVWRVFSVIKKLTPNFVQFNKLPASKLQGVVTRVEM
ncbi:KUP/HAK/KT family potassium transporter [Geotalea uraniireducens]|uniref:Probable potassium transport system protein Kup n=1 Tax=Geotalea uraniireducens (strain Rf4) TaxID=351605 RepID=KUP_GEOUR|nr:KUP/HAK/KT family potassium transporter [Geotalea uraniireducens]A5G9I7.1 RecName: Full=Probable potassium transport system protein Kup [Geotalea uraniireducens Rf4]ABQ28455.1 potassium transporter [Geotalea uraniireducens Rf4]